MFKAKLFSSVVDAQRCLGVPLDLLKTSSSSERTSFPKEPTSGDAKSILLCNWTLIL